MSSYLIFIAANLVLLLASINHTAVSVAFPNIIDTFGTSIVLAGWVMSVYQLVSTGTVLLMAKVSDIFGRKQTFLICLALFITGSFLSAIAPTIHLLILFRVIQAIGGGAFMPITVGIVSDQFPKSRQKAVGLSMSFFPIGGIIGPSIGGWLVRAWGWQAIFWFNVPFGILACIVIALLLKSGKGKKSRIDILGAGFFVGALVSLMIGLSEMGRKGDKSWLLIGALFAASIFLIISFVRHEIRTKNPIVDLEFLRPRAFAAANIYNFVFGASIFGFFSFVPLYATTVYGMSTIESSLLVTSRSVGMVVASVVSSLFVVRWGYRRPMVTGSLLIGLSLVILGAEPTNVSIMGVQLSNIVFLSIVTLSSGLGMGLATPAANNACLDMAPQRAATISGIRTMFRMSGGAISVALISLLVQSVGDMARGFSIAFFVTAVFMLSTIPFVFAMPARANEQAPLENRR